MAKKTTLKDIAERAGVNVMTVSRALHGSSLVADETREMILALAKEMNYVPNLNAKFLRGSKTNIVGLIIEDNTNPYCAHIIQQVQKILRAADYHVLTFNNFENVEDEIEIVRTLCSFNVAGVLLTPARGNSESVRILRQNDVPYVLTSRYAAEGEDNYVIIDNVQTGYLAAKHMLKRHRRKTFFLNQYKGISSVDNRTEGYLRAMREAGFEPNPEWIRYNCATRQDGYQAMSELLASEAAPFSVLCYNDYVAEGVLSSIYAGDLKIPDDIAVMGIDNIESFAIGRRKLTTVDVQTNEVASQSVGLLLDLIKAQEEGRTLPARRIVLEPQIVEGGTT